MKFTFSVFLIIIIVSTKHCELDTISTCLLRKCLQVLLPLIICKVNSSLTSAKMTHDHKFAALKPVLNKPSMNLIFASCSPVSNCLFISELIKRIVVSQTKDNVSINDLHDPMQSLNNVGHSTETDLLRVYNSRFMAKENEEVSVLVMLDLQATFDTIDHESLLHCLSKRAGKKEKHSFGSHHTLKAENVSVPQGPLFDHTFYSTYLLPHWRYKKKAWITFTTVCI